MAVDQVQPAPLEQKPPMTVVQPTEPPPPPPPFTAARGSTDQLSLLDVVSQEGDEYLPQTNLSGLGRFLMAMLWGSVAVALVVAVYVLIANGHWITRYLPR